VHRKGVIRIKQTGSVHMLFIVLVKYTIATSTSSHMTNIGNRPMQGGNNDRE
jgi:hypothetical protein